jgi:hypothetical protein
MNRIRRFVVLFTSEKTEGFVRVSFVRQSGFMFPSCRTRTATRKNVDDLMANQRVMARTFAILRKCHLEFSQHNDIPRHVLVNAQTGKVESAKGTLPVTRTYRELGVTILADRLNVAPALRLKPASPEAKNRDIFALLTAVAPCRLRLSQPSASFAAHGQPPRSRSKRRLP